MVLLLPEGETLDCARRFPAGGQLDQADLAAAKWCWERNHVAGRGSDTLPGAKWLFLPMQTGRGAVGVIGIDRDEPGPLLSPDQQRLLDALSDQTALAIERVNLAEDVERGAPRRRDRPVARGAVDLDFARSAHAARLDPRLREQSASQLERSLDEATKQDLMRKIQEEAERLNRFIGNLMDMTRLETGALRARRERRVVGQRRRRVAARRQDPGRASDRGATARPICRCCGWTKCCSSRCCSTCWTTPRNMRPRASLVDDRGLARRRLGARAGAATRAPASRPPTSTDLREILPRPTAATAGAPAPAWASRSAADSSRRCAARSRAANRTERQRRGVHDHVAGAGRGQRA